MFIFATLYLRSIPDKGLQCGHLSLRRGSESKDVAEVIQVLLKYSKNIAVMNTVK